MSTKDSAASQAAAVYCRDKRGGFIYSKHELDRSSTAHALLEKTVDGLIRPRLEEAIGGPVANLTDWFASAFQPGGWLGIHTDVGLGHVAFVLNLTPDSSEFRGGDLEFAEGHTMGHAVSPKFNSLAAFRVGAGTLPLPHRVAAVDAPRGSLPRLAITGWYTIPGADPHAVSPAILAQEKGRRSR